MSTLSLFKNYFSNMKRYEGGAAASSDAEKKIFKLSSNENFLGCSPHVRSAIHKNLHSLNIYPSPSDIRLRQVIAKHIGEGISADHVVTANGGVNLIQLFVQAFLGEGLECIVPFPSFTPYFGMPAHMGGSAIKVPLNGSDFSLDVPAILSAVTDQTRIIWLASPNNPTGSIIYQDELDELIFSVPDHVLIIYDEVYRQYVTDPNYAQAKKAILAGKNVLALNSFSKAYGLAGLRVGYAYTTVEIADYLRNYFRPFMINTLSQEAAIAALDDQWFVDEVVRQTNIEKEYLYQEFNKLEITYWPGHGNFILVKPDIAESEFINSLHSQGIMVRGGSAFEADGYVRITIGDREANEALVNAIGKIASSKGVFTNKTQ